MLHVCFHFTWLLVNPTNEWAAKANSNMLKLCANTEKSCDWVSHSAAENENPSAIKSQTISEIIFLLKAAIGPSVNGIVVVYQCFVLLLLTIISVCALPGCKERKQNIYRSQRLYHVATVHLVKEQNIALCSYLHWQRIRPCRRWSWLPMESVECRNSPTQRHFSLDATGSHKLDNHMLRRGKGKESSNENKQTTVPVSMIFLWTCSHKIMLP